MKAVLLKQFKRKATIDVALRFFVVTSSERGLIHLVRTLRTVGQFVLAMTAVARLVSAQNDVQRQADDLKHLQLRAGTKIVQEFPKSFHARQVLANVYKTQGDHESLIVTLKACSQLAPTRADIFEQLGLEAFELGDPESAVAHFTRSLKIDPVRRVQVELADALVQTGDFDKASQILDRLSNFVHGSTAAGDAVSDSDVNSTRGAATTSDSANGSEKPSTEDQKASARPVDTFAANVAYLIGEIAFQNGDYEAARRSYRRAVLQQPQHLNAVYGMVKVATQLGDAETAETFSAKFARLQTKIAELNQARRRDYDDLSNLRHHTATTLTDIGRVYDRERRPSDAVRFWRKASKMDRQNIASRKLLASHFLTTKQLSLAAIVCRELVTLEPDQIDHYERLGIVLASSGDVVAAEKAFEAMARRSENSARGRRMLAKFYLNVNKNTDKALRLAKQAVEQEPIADSYFVYGWALAKNSQWDAARKQIERAMQLDRSNPTYRRLHQSLPSGR